MSGIRGTCTKENCDCVGFDAVDGGDGRMCDCGHKRFVHACPSVGSSPRGGGRASVLGSVSDVVSKTFEKEVNEHLNNCLSNSLPGCRLGGIINREITDDPTGVSLMQMDTFGYIYEDSLQEGIDMAVTGVSVITPRLCSFKKSAAAPSDKVSKSPGALLQAEGTRTSEKYVIGETYSGASDRKIEAKVSQLEVTIEKMRTRACDLHSRTCSDVTSLVGAALLSFASGPKNRKDAKLFLENEIIQYLNATTPHLWRLAQARRLFLVVLSERESPVTVSTRSLCTMIEGIGMDVQEINLDVQEIKQKIDSALKK